MKSCLIGLLLCFAASTAFAEIEVLSGSSPQRALVRELLPNPVRLRVLDAGVPVAGANVTFHSPHISLFYGGVGSSDGSECRPGDLEKICTATTGTDGVAQFVTLTSYFARTYTVTMTATNATGTRSLGSAELTFQFDSKLPPMQLSVISGGGQHVLMGAIAPHPIRIQALTLDGHPVANAHVDFRPPSGSSDSLGFDYKAPLVFTDGSGQASSPRIFAGWAVGTHELHIQVFDPNLGAFVTATTEITVLNESGVADVDLTNMWWAGPLENGWGMSVVKHGGQLFNVLFVYDAAGHPTWYVQPGGAWLDGVGSEFNGPVYSPRSAPWFGYDASRLVAGESVGYMSLTFKGPQRASLFANIHTNPIFKNLERQDFTGDFASPLEGVADMWWGGPQQNGWGIAILEQFGNLFLVWFTYGEDGKPIWFVMPGGQWKTPTSYSGIIYRTVGTAWVDATYDASKLQVQTAGNYTITFIGPDRATFGYALEGRMGSLELQRQPFD